MKICLVGDYPPCRGGAAHLSGVLYNNLVSRNHEVMVISWKKKYPDFIYPGKKQEVYTKVLNANNNIRFILNSVNPLTWIETAWFIRKNKVDSIIFHWFTPFMAPAFSTISFLSKLFRKSIVVSICHNVMPHDKNFFDRILNKMFFSFVDSFMVHSLKDLKDLKLLKRNSNAVHGFLPVFDMFKNSKVPKLIAKKRLGIAGKVILFFGYIRPYKGLSDLIKTIPLVLKEINVTLLIVGEVWGNKKIYTDQIKNLDLEKNIVFIDTYVPDDEVQNYFNASNVLVMPYHSGTQSAVIQTAFGFDLPVICTDVGGFKEAVKDGFTGYIVSKGDIEKLADAIVTYFKKNKEKQFIANLKNDKERLSFNRYIELLEKCMSKNFN